MLLLERIRGVVICFFKGEHSFGPERLWSDDGRKLYMRCLVCGALVLDTKLARPYLRMGSEKVHITSEEKGDSNNERLGSVSTDGEKRTEGRYPDWDDPRR